MAILYLRMWEFSFYCRLSYSIFKETWHVQWLEGYHWNNLEAPITILRGLNLWKLRFPFFKGSYQFKLSKFQSHRHVVGTGPSLVHHLHCDQICHLQTNEAKAGQGQWQPKQAQTWVNSPAKRAVLRLLWNAPSRQRQEIELNLNWIVLGLRGT